MSQSLMARWAKARRQYMKAITQAAQRFHKESREARGLYNAMQELVNHLVFDEIDGAELNQSTNEFRAIAHRIWIAALTRAGNQLQEDWHVANRLFEQTMTNADVLKEEQTQ